MKNSLFSITHALILIAGFSTAFAAEIKVTLSGSQEVPPVTTSATGVATVTVNDDMTVSVTVTTTGIAATAAHVHMAPAGQNGGVIVPFTKTGDNTWSSAPGAKLTEAQYAAFKAGNTYVNVHSAANPGGEIRGQIRP